jgi:hypothetical protein
MKHLLAMEDARLHDLETLFGDKPASLGAMFEKFHFGQPVDNNAWVKLVDGRPDLAIQLDPHDHTFHGVKFTLDDCLDLMQHLEKRWGRVYDDDGVDEWYDAKAQQRAQVVHGGGKCEVHVEHYASAAHWAEAAPGSIVPLTALGTPAAKLKALLEQRGVEELTWLDGDDIRWRDDGVEIGWGPTTLAAHVVHGRVTGLRATTMMTADTWQMLADNLTYDYGDATEAKKDAAYVWKRGRIWMTETPGLVTLYAGDRW